MSKTAFLDTTEESAKMERRSLTRNRTAAALSGLILCLPWIRADSAYAFGGELRTHVAEMAALFFAVWLAWQWVGAGSHQREASGAMSSRSVWVPHLCLAAFCLWSCVSLIWTADPLATGLHLRPLLSWALFVFVISLVASASASLHLLVAAMCLAGAFSGAGALARLWIWGSGQHPTGRLQYPYDHPAAFSGALVLPVLVLAVLLIGWLRQRRFAWASGAALLLAPSLTALCLCQTRSSLLGVAAGLWVGLLNLFQGRLRRLVLALGVAALACAGVLALQAFDTPRKWEGLYTGTFGTRVLYGATAVRMGLARPFTGWGAGTFCAVSPGFEPKDDFLHGQRGDIVLTAHSEPLQILGELGFVGLLLWLGLHATGLLATRRAARSHAGKASGAVTEQDASLVRIGLIAALVGMFVDSCGSMSMRYGELPVAYALALGLVLAAGSPEARAGADCSVPAGKRSLVRLAVALGITAVALAWLLAGTVPAVRAECALAAGTRELGEPAVALLRATRAAAGSQRTWFYASYHLAKRLEEHDDFNESLRVRREILRHFPAGPINRQRLVSLLYRTGRVGEAVGICIDGLRLDPYDRRMDAWLGHVLRGTELVQLRAWLVTRPGLGACDQGYLEARLAWQAGNHRTAIRRLQALPLDQIHLGVPRYNLASWHVLMGEREAAWEYLCPLVTRFPADPRALALAARLLVSPMGGALETREAYELLDRAVRLGRAVPEVVSAAAHLYVAGADYAKAEQVVRRAVAENESDPRLWIALVETLQRIGKRREAEAALRRAQRRFPHDPGLCYWADRLQRTSTPQ